MDVVCKKDGLDNELVRLLVELDFDSVIYCKIKVNTI